MTQSNVLNQRSSPDLALKNKRNEMLNGATKKKSGKKMKLLAVLEKNLSIPAIAMVYNNRISAPFD